MFTVKNRYNFTTLASSILGSNYKNMKVVSIMSGSEAVKYRNVQNVNASVVNIIDGLSTDINDLTFVLFEGDGVTVVLAQEWIDESSIEEVSTVTLRVTINTTSGEEASIVSNLLRGAGLTDYKIETI